MESEYSKDIVASKRKRELHRGATLRTTTHPKVAGLLMGLGALACSTSGHESARGAATEAPGETDADETLAPSKTQVPDETEAATDEAQESDETEAATDTMPSPTQGGVTHDAGNDDSAPMVNTPETDAGASSQSSSLEEYASFVTNGTRLSAMYRLHGGARWFVGLFDVQLGVPCEFKTMAQDNRLRCIPIAESLTHYSDAGCSTRAFDTPFACTGGPGSYVSTYADTLTTGCTRTDRYDAWVMGKQNPTSELFQVNSGQCEAVSAIGDVVSAERVDANDFVAGDLFLEEAGGGVWVNRIRAEDGTVLTVATTDADGNPCDTQGGFCVPRSIAYIDNTFFADDACSESVAYRIGARPECDTTAPNYAIEPPRPGACLPPERVYRVTGEVEQHFRDSGECSLESPAEDEFFYTFDPEPITQGLPQLLEHEIEGPELSAVVLTTTTGVVVSTRLEMRGRDDKRCYYEQLVGEGRCLPRRFVVPTTPTLFADAQCSVPVALGELCDYDAAPLLTVKTGDTSCAQWPWTLYEAIPHNGLIYLLQGADCVEHDPGDYNAYTQGAEVSPEMFPLIETWVGR